MSTATKKKVRFYFADGLRGIAATWVVLFHIHAGGHLSNLNDFLPAFVTTVLFEWGHLGVPIFFVLSGFVTAHTLRNTQMSWSFFQNFSLRRIIRLSPPYYFSIVFVLLFKLLSARATGELLELPSLSGLFAHLFYLQDIFSIKPISDIYWTLCLEMQFYAVFCVLLGLSQYLERKFELVYSRPLVFGFSLLVGALWPLKIIQGNVWPGLFLPTWHGFALGAFAYWAWQQRGHYRHLFYGYAGLLVVSTLIGQVNSPETGVFMADATLTCVVVGILLLEIGKADLMQSALNWQWLQFLALVSYSLYLLHNEISGAAFFILYKVVGHTLIAELLGFVAIFGLCVGCATAAYWLLEKPSIGWSRQVKQVTPSSKPVGL
ncbi:MAG: acyltransferase [Cyanobacteria bacterium P01_C01_bin.118]